jgi:hypothetical protein
MATRKPLGGALLGLPANYFQMAWTGRYITYLCMHIWITYIYIDIM